MIPMNGGKVSSREVRLRLNAQAAVLEAQMIPTLQALVNNDHVRQKLLADLKAALGEERTARLRLAEEQRSYVDARDREQWEMCRNFRVRGFWGRMNWLFTGR